MQEAITARNGSCARKVMIEPASGQRKARPMKNEGCPSTSWTTAGSKGRFKTPGNAAVYDRIEKAAARFGALESSRKMTQNSRRPRSMLTIRRSREFGEDAISTVFIGSGWGMRGNTGGQAPGERSRFNHRAWCLRR